MAKVDVDESYSLTYFLASLYICNPASMYRVQGCVIFSVLLSALSFIALIGKDTHDRSRWTIPIFVVNTLWIFILQIYHTIYSGYTLTHDNVGIVYMLMMILHCMSLICTNRVPIHRVYNLPQGTIIDLNTQVYMLDTDHVVMHKDDASILPNPILDEDTPVITYDDHGNYMSIQYDPDNVAHIRHVVFYPFITWLSSRRRSILKGNGVIQCSNAIEGIVSYMILLRDIQVLDVDRYILEFAKEMESDVQSVAPIIVYLHRALSLLSLEELNTFGILPFVRRGCLYTMKNSCTKYFASYRRCGSRYMLNLNNYSDGMRTCVHRRTLPLFMDEVCIFQSWFKDVPYAYTDIIIT